MFHNVDLITALITPFDRHNQINYKSLETLTNHLIQNGSRGFVIGATTGETPELSDNEKIELYKKFGQIVNERAPVIAGVGTNNTRQSVQMTQKISHIEGIDVALEVVPYYNKPDQRGLISHFTTIADNVDIPIMIYNIPGRTGINMENDTIVKLSHHPNIVGIKQCGTMEDMEYLIDHVDSNFVIYSGEDPQAMFAKAIGAHGVVSVASHIYGIQMREMYDAIDDGNIPLAARLQRSLTPKMQALFMYPSPSPTKAVLNAQGFNVGGCRQPIMTLNNEEKNNLALRLNLKKNALNNNISKELKL